MLLAGWLIASYCALLFFNPISLRVLQSKDGRLTIYACDFFLMTPEILGPVDAVYDRGALESINPQDRQNYARVMQSLLGPNFRYKNYRVPARGQLLFKPGLLIRIHFFRIRIHLFF